MAKGRTTAASSPLSLNERERMLLRIAMSFVSANYEDLNEFYDAHVGDDDPDHGKIHVRGLMHPRIGSDEYDRLANKLEAIL